MTATLETAPNTKSIFYDGIYTLVGRILRTILALALSVLVARALGPHDRGLYALPTAVYTGLVLSVFTGISSAVSYFMLNAKAGRGILSPALLTGGIFTVAGAIPVIAMAELGHNGWASVPSLLLLPANVPTMIILGYALGTKRIRWQTSYSVISTAVLLIGMGVALGLFARTAIVAVAGFVLLNALIATACLIIVIRDARTLPYRHISLREFMLFALRVGVVNLVTLLNYRADLYVVALLATPTVLGEYAVAISAAESLLVVTQVAAVVTSPHVGSLEREDAAQLTARCVRVTFAVAFLICAASYAIAPYAVGLLYGSAYLALVPALRILLVAVMILSLGSPLSNFFTLKLGNPEIPLASAACAAGLCLVASWFLVPRVGMIGAAAATAAAYFLGEGIAIAFFMRMTKISLVTLLIPTRGDLDSYARMGKSLVHDVSRKIAV
ncbi:MAG: oligosaccharide flippase family protein [Vulcanimicrobiaceae bacterium]